MDPSAHAFGTPPSPASHPGPQRSLNDPVLSSAEDELDLDGMPQAGPTWTAAGEPAGGTAAPWWAQAQDRVERFVSERPGRAALMALGAGALAALVLGQGLRGRRRKD